MKHTRGMFALIGALLLALGPSAAAPAWAQAATPRQCTTMDLMMITDDCTGEVITLTGVTLTTCSEAVFDANGGGHAIVHVQGQGFGVSTSGSKYVFVANATGVINLPSSSTDVLTAVASAALIGQGSTANEVVDVLLHVTVDANGIRMEMLERQCSHEWSSPPGPQ